ncbi:hypothetical protein H323_20500 [Vibrio parahaemolyticus VP766]|nr:hypothetical protein H323_20500 [Vibrio parahaemolyticus VP766]KIT52549.1 hypothetical protein H337_20630 [Vibrio parahaemolyticus EN9701121]
MGKVVIQMVVRVQENIIFTLILFLLGKRE